MGRFLNADGLVSTGQGILCNNMFAYCLNNPVAFIDASGTAPQHSSVYQKQTSSNGGSRYGPNIRFLMAFYGVDSPSEVPKLPNGAMIFAENITSVSFKNGSAIVEGRTIVMDQYRYCEYSFVGYGWGISMSMPLDRSITQGYVYGLENVGDYCGFFIGTSSNMLSIVQGGVYANPKVYAEIMGGMSYAPSLGVSATYYMTAQADWIYGPANLVVVTNPYQGYPPNQSSCI